MVSRFVWAVASAFLLLAGTARAEDPIGVVKRAKGEVRIERAGVHIPAARGTLIQPGDRVITGPNGSASIALRRAAPVSVGPSVDMALDRFAAEERPLVKREAPAILQGLASYLAVNRQR